MNNVKIIDCTLRDGGYYNSWDFNKTLVKKLVSSLDNSNIDIVEIGYKSIYKEKFMACTSIAQKVN